MIPLITLAVVFLLIAVRQIGRVRFQIWQIMLLGAIVVLITGSITPADAVGAIDVDVMLFLFGVFSIGRAIEDSGLLDSLSARFFSKAATMQTLVLIIIISTGLLSAFLMNDTIAIIGTPVVLALARKTGIKPQVLLLSLAFAVTTGSVMSPIGNPQNLLIAIHGGIDNPFVSFFRYLALPTLLNMGIAFFFIRILYRDQFSIDPVPLYPQPVIRKNLARLAGISLGLLAALIIIKIILIFCGAGFDIRLSWIALTAAIPVLVFNHGRIRLIRTIDWHTLIFFAAMFILMASVWNTGTIQEAADSMNLNMHANGTIMAVSILLSQLISNVPLVALYLPIISGSGGSAEAMMALAAGSTIAGNLTILGAASNIIIIQNAEKQGGITLSFLEFIRIGIPLTVTQSIVYWLFLLIR